MSQTIRKSSPFSKMMWWVWTICTGGIYAFFVGKPQ